MRIGKFFTFIAALLATGAAFAQDNLQGLETVGKPVEGLMGFQPAVTPSMHDIVWLDNMLLIIISAISLFVLALIIWVIVRYNKRANPEPSRFTHNSVIEVLWTVVPTTRKRFARQFGQVPCRNCSPCDRRSIHNLP